MNRETIALAGIAGDLGGRIARALVARGAQVRALVQPDAAPATREHFKGDDIDFVTVDWADEPTLVRALDGVACLVSAQNGLRPIIIDRQTVMLQAAVSAGVPRFIPSDFAMDFTRTRAGLNRNLDLRREFMARVDQAPIQATSIFNGAFMDMLGEEVPIIQPKLRRVFYWRSADQPLDWTTKDDVAAFTAAAALDVDAPRHLRIAGDSVTVREMAAMLTEIAGRAYKPMSAGGIGALSAMIGMARLFQPGRDIAFPAWQGMQYLRDMFTGAGKLHPLDNGRYPGIGFTRIRPYLLAKNIW